MLVSLLKDTYHPLMVDAQVSKHLASLLVRIVNHDDYQPGPPYVTVFESLVRTFPRNSEEYVRHHLYKYCTNPGVGWYISGLVVLWYPEYNWGVLPDTVRTLYLNITGMVSDCQELASIVLHDAIVEMDGVVERLVEQTAQQQMVLDYLCTHLGIAVDYKGPPATVEAPIDKPLPSNVITLPTWRRE